MKRTTMPPPTLSRAIGAGVALVTSALVGGAIAAPASAAPPATSTVDTTGPASTDATPYTAELTRWAADTWRSMAAMTDPTTGLPADNIDGDLTPASASGFTSPTNIGGYLWSTLAVRDLGIIGGAEAHDRVATTIGTLETLERNAASGMFYNWYSPADGSKLTTWPENGTVVNPFLSTVDNGWLAAGLRMVANAEADNDPALSARARALYDSMDFGVFYDPQGKQPVLPAGANRGGFWETPPVGETGCEAPAYNGAPVTLVYTCHHYDTTVSESRIATYLGIVNGQIPASGMYGTFRTMPDGCDWSWQEQRPTGQNRVYDGLTVYEGAYSYDGMSFVPSWGGSMFEALMPSLLVPEEQWGPTSWGLNHPITVAVQEKHGEDAGYGYWGFSPSSNPAGGYREYGVDLAGMKADGYLSDQESTDVDQPYRDCPDADRGHNPDPSFGDGVVTPHASFLALGYDPAAAVANLRGIENDLHAYGPGGFYDAVAVKSGTIAKRYLSLDQSMVLAAVSNAVDHGAMRRHFADGQVRDALQPLMAAQTFSAAWATDDAVTVPGDGGAGGGGGAGEPGQPGTGTQPVGDPGPSTSDLADATTAAPTTALAATGSRAGDSAAWWAALALITVGAGAAGLLARAIRRRRDA